MSYILDIVTLSETSTEPVALPEMKAYLHVDFANDDFLISLMISSARRRLEKFTGRSFVPKTVIATLQLDGNYELPYGPVNAISEVTKINGDDSEVLQATDYNVYGEAFKSFSPHSTGMYKVEYTAGNNSLPEDLKLAIMAEVGYRYENRGDENVKGISDMAYHLAHPYKRLSVTV